jgi:hypothetical protein
MLDQRVLVRAYGWTDGCFEFNLDEKHMGDDRLTVPRVRDGPAGADDERGPRDGQQAADRRRRRAVTPLNVIAGENPQAVGQRRPSRSAR